MIKTLVIGWIVGMVICMAILLSGCTPVEQGTAVVIATTFAEAQVKATEALNAVNTETIRMNELADGMRGAVLLTPELAEAASKMKGREKDPVTWVAAASILANMFWGGKTYGKRKSN